LGNLIYCIINKWTIKYIYLVIELNLLKTGCDKMKSKIICIFILLVLLLVPITSVSSMNSVKNYTKNSDDILSLNEDSTHNIGKMEINGETPLYACDVQINEDYESDYSTYEIFEYNDGDTITLTANWKIINDVRTLPPVTERWYFRISVKDPLQNDISEMEEITIEDTLDDESGKNGIISLDLTIPRYGFHHNLVEKGKKELEIRLYCVYYIKDGDEFDEEDWDHDYGYIDVYPSNQIPSITDTSMSTDVIRFNEPVTFSVSATDSDGDPVRFFFDWNGDGYNDYEQDDVVTLFADGSDVTISHTWYKEDYPDQMELQVSPTVYVQDKIAGTSQGVSFGDLTVDRKYQLSLPDLFIQLLCKLSKLSDLFNQIIDK
jgi:hypothetical protein